MIGRSAVAPAAISGAAGVLVLLATVVGVGQPTVERSWDLLWPAGQSDERVVVVAIDERSLEAVGSWPWSDDRQAELLTAIAAAEPAAVGYDVLLGPRTEPTLLADALGEAPFILARGFASVAVTGRVPVAGGDVPLDESLTAAAHGVGHAAVTADRDGIVRTVPLVVESPQGDLVPSLALAVSAASSAAEGTQPLVRRNAVSLGDVTARSEPGALLRLSWSRGLGVGDAAVVSAIDVLEGRVDARVLDGAFVVVGVTAPALGDRHVTPLQPGATTPGVFVQAQALSTILARSWVTPLPGWANGAMTAVLAFAPVLLALVSRLRWTVLALVLALVASVAGVVVVFGTTGRLGDVVRVPLALLLATGVGVGIRAIQEAARRREAVDLFSRYVPERVARELLASGRADTATVGVRARVAVLFCDLRGFTPLAATLEPAVVREILDAYYAEVCDVVFARAGTVMQFVGDEVFAVFGAPVVLGDPASPALDAADALVDRGPSFRESLVSRGLPEVTFGIGVHVGDVVATHVGPPGRRQYAVVGDAVNVGSRLCGLAAGGEVVASVAALEGRDHSGRHEEVRVKGKDQAIAVVRWTADARV